MMWNQPQKKGLSPAYAQDMIIICEAYGHPYRGGRTGLADLAATRPIIHSETDHRNKD